MTAVHKVKPWLFLAAAAALVVALGLVALQHFRATDPCLELEREALLSTYPELRELWERQQRETERLLARHRAQDVSVNVQLGAERITPEEALRLSLGQIDELAALRREHQEIFHRTCRELARRG